MEMSQLRVPGESRQPLPYLRVSQIGGEMHEVTNKFAFLRYLMSECAVSEANRIIQMMEVVLPENMLWALYQLGFPGITRNSGFCYHCGYDGNQEEQEYCEVCECRRE